MPLIRTLGVRRVWNNLLSKWESSQNVINFSLNNPTIRLEIENILTHSPTCSPRLPKPGRLLARSGLLAILCLGAATLHAEPALLITSVSGPPISNTTHTGFADRITLEAFRRINRKVELIKLPAQRALLEANEGIIDGDLLRVKEIPKTYTNLRRVPEKIMDYEFMVFTRHLQLTPQGWDSLKAYDVGVIGGWKILEKNLQGSRSMTRGNDTRHAMRLLASDRVDLIVATRWLGLQAIRDLGLSDVRLLEPPVETREMFLMLHKRHTALLDGLAEALRAMKRDGTYQRLYDDTLGRLMSPAQMPAAANSP